MNKHIFKVGLSFVIIKLVLLLVFDPSVEDSQEYKKIHREYNKVVSIINFLAIIVTLSLVTCSFANSSHLAGNLLFNFFKSLRGIFNFLGCPAVHIFIPTANYVCGRVYCFHVVRPSKCPTERTSDRVSVTFCFLNILKNH